MSNLQAQRPRAIAAKFRGGAQGALVSLDRDGAVRAMVGGLDYVTSNYNRATQANRQPGSAWKLFVYLAALETGYTPDANVDARPITIKGWSPRGSAPGPVPLRKAFALSINTAAVRLAQEVGFGTVGDMARRFGITTPVASNPAMALGSSEVRLVDMARAYASVANQGVAVVPYGVRRVTTAAGTVVFEHHVDGSRTLVHPVGRGADDRPAAVGRRQRTGRARRSAGRRRARPAPPRPKRTAISSASRAASPPACGSAATTTSASPASRAARTPQCISRLHGRPGREPPVEQFTTEGRDARNGRRTSRSRSFLRGRDDGRPRRIRASAGLSRTCLTRSLARAPARSRRAAGGAARPCATTIGASLRASPTAGTAPRSPVRPPHSAARPSRSRSRRSKTIIRRRSGAARAVLRSHARAARDRSSSSSRHQRVEMRPWFM
jgi:hypothetical protein